MSAEVAGNIKGSCKFLAGVKVLWHLMTPECLELSIFLVIITVTGFICSSYEHLIIIRMLGRQKAS